MRVSGIPRLVKSLSERASNSAAPLSPPMPAATSSIAEVSMISSVPVAALTVGWPGGVAPPGSLRSRRDSLPSPGSSLSVQVESADPPPLGEQMGLSIDQSHPPPLEPLVSRQPLVLLPSPAPQVGVDALEEGFHRRSVEPAVEGHPSSHDG